MEYWKDSNRSRVPFRFIGCYRVYSMWESTIEPTLANTRHHSDVTSITYAHFTYFSLVDPKKVWKIGKIAIGPGCLLYFFVANGYIQCEKAL